MPNPVKQLLYEVKARKKLQEGVNKLAKAVVTTLGPRGRNVAIERSWGAPIVLHDGVSVAREVFLEDGYENMGAQLVKEAAQKTNDQAGDGTTTATLFAQHIVNEGMDAINAGHNPMFMKKGIDKAVIAISKNLEKQSKPVKKSDWRKVAAISAQSDFIGEKIEEALKLVGETGLVEVDASSTGKVEVEHTEGLEFGKGYLSPYFVTDIPMMIAELEKPFILITDKRLSALQPLMPIMAKAKNAGRPMLIIAENIDGSCLTDLVVNKMKGVYTTVAVSAPIWGNDRNQILEDIAIVTGGRVVSSNTGLELDDKLQLEDLGICSKAIVTKDSTRIVGGDGTSEEVKARIKQLEKQRENVATEFEKTKLNERIAKMANGVAVIKVGATTETEEADLIERVKDAVGATKAAIEEGIIPGGGVALIKAIDDLEELKQEAKNSDEKVGIEIVKTALYQPTYWLANNSGADPDLVIKKIIANKTIPNYGFNANTLEYGDMLALGIIDPVKVTRLAMINGASVASMILTTECLVALKPEKDVSKTN